MTKESEFFALFGQLLNEPATQWTPEKVRQAAMSTHQSILMLHEIPIELFANTMFYDVEDKDRLAPFGANVTLDLLAGGVTGLMVALVNHLSAKSVKYIDCMGEI